MQISSTWRQPAERKAYLRQTQSVHLGKRLNSGSQTIQQDRVQFSGLPLSHYPSKPVAKTVLEQAKHTGEFLPPGFDRYRNTRIIGRNADFSDVFNFDGPLSNVSERHQGVDFHKFEFVPVTKRDPFFRYREVTSFLDFSCARLVKADFSSSRLLNAGFQESVLPYANFKNATLPNISFFKAVLPHVDFQNANLKGANLMGADLSTARNLETAQLQDAHANRYTKFPPGFDPRAHGIRQNPGTAP